MTSDLTSTGTKAGGNLAAASDGKLDGAAVFYPPRYVTGIFLKEMGWEFIRPDQVKSQWKTIHKENP